MPGLLADVNVQGYLPYLRRLLERLDLLAMITEMGLTLETFRDRGLPRDLDDRPLWNYCQQYQFVLFTENRNREDENSLQATIDDSWRQGHLPVLTLANKGRFAHSEEYALRVAEDIADALIAAFHDGLRDQARIFVPR